MTDEQGNVQQQQPPTAQPQVVAPQPAPAETPVQTPPPAPGTPAQTAAPVSVTPPPAAATVTPNTPVADGNANSATIALVCGLCSFTGILLAIAGWVLGIIAIVMGAKGLKSSKRSMAMAGLICGIVGLVIAAINSFLGVLYYVS